MHLGWSLFRSCSNVLMTFSSTVGKSKIKHKAFLGSNSITRKHFGSVWGADRKALHMRHDHRFCGTLFLHRSWKDRWAAPVRPFDWSFPVAGNTVLIYIVKFAPQNLYLMALSWMGITGKRSGHCQAPASSDIWENGNAWDQGSCCWKVDDEHVHQGGGHRTWAELCWHFAGRILEDQEPADHASWGASAIKCGLELIWTRVLRFASNPPSFLV